MGGCIGGVGFDVDVCVGSGGVGRRAWASRGRHVVGGEVGGSEVCRGAPMGVWYLRGCSG
jgi:hypothetical protein